MIGFEDNEKSPVSRMIRCANKDTVFVGRNVKLKDLLLSDPNIICYVDVSPDNYNTVDLYHELKNLLERGLSLYHVSNFILL